jgi:hypothetical protein
MSKLIHIPKIGHVEFPDNMPDQEIAKHASRLHSDARSAVVSKFMENDPAHTGMSHSERLKALSTITGLLEKYPRLADAVDKGIGQG